MPETISTVAGYGFDASGFGGPAAGLDLRQATPGTTELGRIQGVAVDSGGRILVSSTATNTIGRIAAPASWTRQELGEVLTGPTGAQPWKFYSPSAAAAASFEATTYAGTSAVHWVVTDADSRTVLYQQPTITGGATGHCSVRVVGSGTLTLDLWNGGVETYSQTVQLSDTPQLLVAEKVFSPPWVQFKLRCPVAQSRVEVTAYDASILQSQVTGDTQPIAGRPNQLGDSGDGGPATAARLNAPTGIAVAPDGSIVVADSYNNRVRRIDPRGRITTIAGTGEPGYDDSSRATLSRLDHPQGVAVGPDGTVYVADTYNNRVRGVRPDGTVRTLAGTGKPGDSGDGGRATAAWLDHPQGVAVAPDGTVYIADTYNHRVRRVDASGRIATVAGTGVAGYAGDGGPATSARLCTPYDIDLAPDGTLLIADTVNNRVRRVRGGTIDTLAGSGAFGVNGRTGGAASAAQLSQPLGVAVDPRTGDVYVVETTQAVLRITAS